MTSVAGPVDREPPMYPLTAIVPTYRRPALLGRALASIAAQSARPAEVIVVEDDPSEIGTTRRVVACSGMQNIRVVANRRASGASGARNSGADLARGDLLAFLDDDDEWLPGFVASAAGRCTEHELDLVCTDVVKRYEDGSERPGKSAPDRLVPGAFLTRNPGMGGSNFVIRRSRFRQVGGFDQWLPTLNDMDLGLRLSLIGHLRYAPLHDRLVRQHIHRGPRLSTPRTPAKCEGVRRFYELHAHRMTASQRLAFRANVMRLWGIDEKGQLVAEVKV